MSNEELKDENTRLKGLVRRSQLPTNDKREFLDDSVRQKLLNSHSVLGFKCFTT